MTDVFQFALLGLGIGSIYALLAAGLVLIYRGSGTINLAHGHFAVLAAYLFVDLRDRQGLPTLLVLVLVVLLGALLGAAVHLLVMVPLRSASPITRVIATLGVLATINAVVDLRYGAEQQRTEPLLPSDSAELGDIVVGQQNLYLSGIALVVIAALVLASRGRWGLALSAAAENPRAASSLGWSPQLLAVATWSLGGALAGLAGSLVFSTTGGYFNQSSLSLLVVGALACALLAQFRSFTVALLAGWLIAIAQSEATQYINITGLAEAIPFLAIVLILVVRGRGLPVRGTVADRLPTVGTGRVRPVVVLGLAAIGIAYLQSTQDLGFLVRQERLQPIIVSLCFAIVAVSVVVLTGFAGQLSLAQMGLAGIGAFAAGRLVAANEWSFLPALLAGVAVAAAAGCVLGLPALRTRGVNLTVVTFGLGFAVYAIVFSSTELTGGTEQTRIPPQKLFGLEIDPLFGKHNYATVCLVALVTVCLIVANLRRGRAGRRLLAVRVNERAAASIGISVLGAKLYAFTLASAIAGLGGVLYGFAYQTIPYNQLFGPFSSIDVLMIAVIGGVGWVMGPIVGCGLAAGGVGVLVTDALFPSLEDYLPLISGVVLIVLLIAHQNGMAAVMDEAARRILPKRVFAPLRLRRRPAADASRPSNDVGTTERLPLSVSGVTLRFGGVVALEDVSLDVQPGTVVGLLGPNGAGKTSLVDVVTGYAQPSSGTVCLGGTDITSWSATKRSRAGLGRTFQALELFDDLTVSENLMAASDRRDLLAYLTDLVWPGRSRLTGTAAAAVDELELAETLDRRPRELSYGQQRLVAIARAVATRPAVLLLDEPCAGLDEHESAELGHLIRRLADEWRIAVLLIEHDVDLVLNTSDRVVVLESGRVIFEGAPGDVSADPRVRSAYLGLPIDEDESATV